MNYCKLCGLRNSHWSGCTAAARARTIVRQHDDATLDEMIRNIAKASPSVN